MNEASPKALHPIYNPEVDVSIPESVAALVDTTVSQMGRLDVMFNNAGTLRPGTVVELDVDDWDLVMGVNVRSVYLGGKYAIPVMLDSGGGSIINTSSIGGIKSSSVCTPGFMVKSKVFQMRFFGISLV